ncbi:MAG: hypothetical protein ACKPKO_16700, partial [Candidatus Fonsibacter sp.]
STINRYFITTNDIKAQHNIAYISATCQSVSEEVRSNLLKQRAVRDGGEAHMYIVVQSQQKASL